MDRKLQYHVLGFQKKQRIKLQKLTKSNMVMSEHGEVVPLLCPGDRSDGVRAGLSPGQEGLTTGPLSLTDLQVHPQASPLSCSTQPCSFSLLSVSSNS